MMIASALLANYEVGHQVEACFQNFAAGLIISAGNGVLTDLGTFLTDLNTEY